jgi:hypothetical protein
MKLTALAQSVKAELGYSYRLELNYPFVTPEENTLSERQADAVIFSSPIPSIQTATIGFAKIAQPTAEELSAYAYLGAPLLVAATNEHLSIYQYRGTPVAEQVEQQPLSSEHTTEWLRDRLLDKIESPQLSLSFGASKNLLVQDTRAALSSRVSALMDIVHAEQGIDEVNCFRIAMAVIRQISFGSQRHSTLTAEQRRYARNLASRVKETISFANIPPESIAELYETFAIGAETKRRKGVVYTPAWLARYVVNRLPADAFRSGQAIDPTCGSGTFLVCFLERLAEERAKSGKEISPEVLSQAVVGIDIDPVAIEASRLSLDFFCKAVKVDYPEWNLLNQDATTNPIRGEWVIGNLPFGYRTYEGKKDVSSVILENIEDTNERKLGLSLILPDSLAYTATADRARELLRSNYQIQEVTRLPESAFETSAAATMVIVGRTGKSPREVVIREVSDQDLWSFRVGSYVSKTYVARFPEPPRDPWRFSPFNNYFERAERSGVHLEDLANIHIGLQIYGSESKVLSTSSQRDGKPLLTDPDDFLRWANKSIKTLMNLVGERKDVRRPGPWKLFDAPKVIIRTTTAAGSHERLAAIPDYQGVWFTDKFAGIWLKDESISLNALAAYLQTRFARIWFETNNPSRKLRTATLYQLPIPLLPNDWWERASKLAKSNTVVRPIQSDGGSSASTRAEEREWAWFNSIVETAFGFDPSGAAMFDDWLSKPLQSTTTTRLFW